MFKRKERIEKAVVKEKVCRRNEEVEQFEQLEEEDADEVTAGPSTGNNTTDNDDDDNR